MKFEASTSPGVSNEFVIINEMIISVTQTLLQKICEIFEQHVIDRYVHEIISLL